MQLSKGRMWLAEATASAKVLGYKYVGCSQAGKARAERGQGKVWRDELRKALDRGLSLARVGRVMYWRCNGQF